MNNYQTQPQRPLGFIPQQTNHIRPVSSFEEVRGAAIDFDGSIFFFPDFANKRIYTKQVNMDGTAGINMYELAPLPSIDQMTYVTKEEFTKALEELKQTIVNFTQPPVESQNKVNSQPVSVKNF